MTECIPGWGNVYLDDGMAAASVWWRGSWEDHPQSPSLGQGCSMTAPGEQLLLPVTDLDRQAFTARANPRQTDWHDFRRFVS